MTTWTGASSSLAQVCNPVCAGQPPQCCAPVAPPPPILAEECTGSTSDTVHFILPDAPGGPIGWIDLRSPATFDVSGTSGTLTFTIGTPPMLFNVGVAIGSSDASARFQVLEASTLTQVGQCVGLSGVVYNGLPTMVTVNDGVQTRMLLIRKAGPLYCRYTPTGGAQTDILCLQVKGDVGAPFESGQICQADRVEYFCGVVH